MFRFGLVAAYALGTCALGTLGSCVMPARSGDAIGLADHVAALEASIDTLTEKLATRPALERQAAGVSRDVSRSFTESALPAEVPVVPETSAESSSPHPDLGRLVDEIAALRQVLVQRHKRPTEKPSETTPTAATLGTEATSVNAPSTTPHPERGRFQIAGEGARAWQTVLDTRTGVIYNLRYRDGRPSWVPITPSLSQPAK